MNRKNRKLALVGGDLRQRSAAGELMRAGYTVTLFGFDTYDEPGGEPSLPVAESEASLREAEILLLPLPVFRGDCLNMPFSRRRMTGEELLPLLGGGLRFAVGGLLPPEFAEQLRGRGVECFDLCEDERFNILNAVPTAEGALAIAMSGMKTTLSGSRAAVLGFGRIGKALCRLLTAVGASVTVAARSDRDRAAAEVSGCRAVSYDELPAAAREQDVLFNTVPHIVVTEEILSGLKRDAFLIDLASRPGGVDGQAASRCGVRVISALSLPGKVAPVTAGRIIAECTVRRLKEAGL